MTKIIQGDCLEVMRKMEPESVDAIVTDPPYAIGATSLDTSDVFPLALPPIYRLLKADGWLAFFGVMPTAAHWCEQAASVGFKWREHIVWVKRIVIPHAKLMRGHESIFVFRKGDARFHTVRGPYMDVKFPLLLAGCLTLDALQRRDADMWFAIRRGGRIRKRPTTGKRQKAYERYKGGIVARPDANFTNVWSFLPVHRAKTGLPYNHPHEKPVVLLKRIVELLTPHDALVLDPFCGSGSTGEACRRLGRAFVGIELSEAYCEIARRRLAQPMSVELL